MSKQDIRDKVQKRIQEEAAASPPNPDKKPSPLPLDFLVSCLHANRVGDATLYAALHRDRYVYVERWKEWLRWAGHHWEIDINQRCSLAAVERVCEEYQRIITEKNLNDEDDLYKLIRRRLNTLREKSGRENVLTCAATIAKPLAIDGQETDLQDYLLACANGVIDLRTGEIGDGRPEDYILKSCPTEFHGLDQPSPHFDAFLSSCHADDAIMAAYILRLLGYGIQGRRDDHIWAIFHGPRGRNGKDTLMKICFDVLGNELVTKIPTSTLLQQTFQRSGAQPDPDILSLRGARLAFANEAEGNQKLAMSRIKELTGGSKLSARGVSDKYFTQWDQTHLLFFMTNDLPKIKSDDDAFWTRVHAIHWPVRFVDEPEAPDERRRDPQMFNRLRAERSGILARLVQGAMDYFAQGLNPPEKVKNYTREQREAFDDIGQFLADCCLREPTPPPGGKWLARTAAADFAAVCNWWLRETFGNAYPYSAKRITQALERKGIHSQKSNKMHYIGVTINPETLAEYAEATPEKTSWPK
ncbi:MAG: hypothetical protein LBH14_07090 [Desulfobulbaceae bacterium]|jgi:putative DNA primase/helicase|nr:hypothetical protein [Desulfobulbaceae bacterium]